ncbi:uncharacterized protein LOC103515692, partial [Diaphorina citri]|uniref:Uncharacterized protein LOC103515692 n=1 Tax=Diaphorina citri TaxID=121845 RepID=A0A3Q0JAW9_DIACI
MTSLAAEVKAKTSHWRLSRTRGFDQKRKARVFLNDPFENETDTISISMQDITPPGFNRRLRHGTDSSQDSGIHKDISTNELATSSSSEDSGTTTEHRWRVYQTCIDGEFIKLVGNIFGSNLVNKFKLEKPSAFIELLLNFESKKRSASNDRKQSSYGIFPPFSFIEFYKNNTGKEIGDAVKEFNREGISWSSQGMLKLSHSVMERLFQITLDKIVQVIQRVLFKRGLIEGTCNHGGLIGDAVKEFNREGISWSSQGMLKLSHSVMERLFQTTLDKILQ